MISFWLICAVMIIIAVAFVLPPLIKGQEQSNATEVREANVAVYRDQLRELEADYENGIVGKEQHAQDRDEIERRLLEDIPVSVAGQHEQNRSNNDRLVIWGSAFVVLGLASLFVPLLASQFRALIRFEEMLGNAQPAVGFFIALIGGVLLLYGARSNRAVAYALTLGLPLVAVSFYLPLANQNARVGAKSAEESPPANAAPFANQGGEMTPQAIEANVARLAKKLEENPNDAKGWVMLARSYSQMQRYKDAAEAYEHATALDSKNADLWVDYATAVMMINGKEMQGKPTEFIKKALAIDPLNPNALTLAGGAAFALKNYDQAIVYWERLLKSLPPNSPELSQALNEKIAEAKRLAKAGPAK